MLAGFHEIEAEIRYLTTEEGGRKTSMYSDYRGQFFYDGADYDGFQYYPDLQEDEPVTLGTPVRTLIRFLQERWDEVHAQRVTVGMPFLIREGNKTVGRGVVTKV